MVVTFFSLFSLFQPMKTASAILFTYVFFKTLQTEESFGGLGKEEILTPNDENEPTNPEEDVDPNTVLFFMHVLQYLCVTHTHSHTHNTHTHTHTSCIFIENRDFFFFQSGKKKIPWFIKP